MELPNIRDLDAAEAAYQRSLALRDPNDALGRSMSIQLIGMVHHERFTEARRQGEPQETQLEHAQAAEKHYQQALDLCPASAVTDLGPLHAQSGNLYNEVGQTERGREHYEKAAQYFDRTGDRYRAGKTRFNMAVMYSQDARLEETATRQRDLFLRAEAYAQSAHRDFQTFKGRAAADEAKARKLLDDIEQSTAKLTE